MLTGDYRAKLARCRANCAAERSVKAVCFDSIGEGRNAINLPKVGLLA